MAVRKALSTGYRLDKALLAEIRLYDRLFTVATQLLLMISPQRLTLSHLLRQAPFFRT